jgi:molybdopterin-binding protein
MRGPVDVGKPLRKKGLTPVATTTGPDLAALQRGPIDEGLRPNALPGKAVAITKRATPEPVMIEVGAETMVTMITNEAVEALALERGKAASAVIKASDVVIMIDV